MPLGEGRRDARRSLDRRSKVPDRVGELMLLDVRWGGEIRTHLRAHGVVVRCRTGGGIVFAFGGRLVDEIRTLQYGDRHAQCEDEQRDPYRKALPGPVASSLHRCVRPSTRRTGCQRVRDSLPSRAMPPTRRGTWKLRPGGMRWGRGPRRRTRLTIFQLVGRVSTTYILFRTSEGSLIEPTNRSRD